MSDGKSILIDTSRCTGCRGCQVACKQWNGLPGTQTIQTGSYQNPPDLTHDTYKLVRFAEGRKSESREPYWYFFADMCRHCLNPGCMSANNNNEILRDEATGAIIFTKETKNIDFKVTLNKCPYDIPRQNPTSNVIAKCTMCLDRIRSGLKPACVLACPTAMEFGDRENILKLAEERVAELQKTKPWSMAIDAEEVRVIFIVTAAPDMYHKYAQG